MRGDLVENEPKRLEIWEKNGLYHKITAARKAAGAPDFILHDGPPFANGDVGVFPICFSPYSFAFSCLAIICFFSQACSLERVF